MQETREKIEKVEKEARKKAEKEAREKVEKDARMEWEKQAREKREKEAIEASKEAGEQEIHETKAFTDKQVRQCAQSAIVFERISLCM